MECRGEVSYYCVQAGEFVVFEDCRERGPASFCEPQTGSCMGCVAGERQCRGQTVVECGPHGRAEVAIEVCEPGDVCANGRCLSAACLPDACCGPQTTLGCEFAALPLQATGQGEDLVLLLVNESREDSVEVELRVGLDHGEVLLERVEVPAGDEATMVLTGLPHARPGVESGALRIVASDAIGVQQLYWHRREPRPATGTDGATLLPGPALGQEHVVALAYDPGWTATATDVREVVSVVAVAEGATEVVLRAASPLPRIDHLQVEPLPGGGLRASLRQHQVLTIVKTSAPDEVAQRGLSGAGISASQRVAVFVSGVAAFAAGPAGEGPTYHQVHEQLPPREGWGELHAAVLASVVAPAPPASVSAWTVVGDPDTALDFEPAAPPGAPESLPPSGAAHFHSTAPLLLTTSAPVSLVRGVGATLATVPPLDWAHSQHVFAAPPSFAPHGLTVLARSADTVHVDGAALPEDALEPLGPGAMAAWSTAVVSLDSGVHRVSAERGAVLLLDGEGEAGAYAWPASLAFGGRKGRTRPAE